MTPDAHKLLAIVFSRNDGLFDIEANVAARTELGASSYLRRTELLAGRHAILDLLREPQEDREHAGILELGQRGPGRLCAVLVQLLPEGLLRDPGRDRLEQIQHAGVELGSRARRQEKSRIEACLGIAGELELAQELHVALIVRIPGAAIRRHPSLLEAGATVACPPTAGRAMVGSGALYGGAGPEASASCGRSWRLRRGSARARRDRPRRPAPVRSARARTRAPAR